MIRRGSRHSISNERLDADLLRLFESAARPDVPAGLRAYPAHVVRRPVRRDGVARRSAAWRGIGGAIAAAVAIVAVAFAAVFVQRGFGPAGSPPAAVTSGSPLASVSPAPTPSPLPSRMDAGEFVLQRTSLPTVSESDGSVDSWQFSVAGRYTFAIATRQHGVSELRRSSDGVEFGGPVEMGGGTFGNEDAVNSVAFDGRRYVAVGVVKNPPKDYVGTSAVWTSEDGATWEVQAATGIPRGVGLGSIVHGPSGFVAVAQASLYYSTDATHWSVVAQPDPNAVSYVRPVVSGSTYIAQIFLADGTDYALRSTDGVHWSRLEVTGSVESVVAIDGGWAIAVGNGDGPASVLTSADGIEWAPQAAPDRLSSCNAAALFCDGELDHWFSADGSNWHRVKMPQLSGYGMGPAAGHVYLDISEDSRSAGTYVLLPK